MRKCLKENGVVKGIIEKKIDEIFIGKLLGQEVLVARGVQPENGQDASIKLIFKAQIAKPEDCIDSRGRVDFKQMRQANIVEAGEVIAEIIPSTPGKEGYNVTGNVLLPKPGKEEEFTSTQDIGVSPENNSHIIALKTGILKKDFTIDEVNFINGNVDYSTGNIDYPKSIIIKGDVKSGFSVRCDENIEVRGCVEDAEVIAEGDIVVKQGVIGTGKGLIKGRNITIGHIKQQNVIAAGDIFVGGEVMHGELKAGGYIKMIGVRGILIGGSVSAVKGIEVINAGNNSHVKTFLQVGYDEKIGKMEEQLQSLHNYRDKVNTALRIMKVADKVNQLSQEKKQVLGQLLETRKSLTGKIENLNTIMLGAIDKLITEEKPYIKLLRSVFPNTTIQIGHKKLHVSSELRNKTFRLHKDNIIGA